MTEIIARKRTVETGKSQGQDLEDRRKNPCISRWRMEWTSQKTWTGKEKSAEPERGMALYKRSSICWGLGV